MTEELMSIYENYLFCLSETNKGIIKLKKIYDRIAEHTLKGLSCEPFKESFHLARQNLSELNMHLMESFINFNCNFDGFNAEQMAEIKKYRDTFDEASCLCVNTEYSIRLAIESRLNSNDIIVD